LVFGADNDSVSGLNEKEPVNGDILGQNLAIRKRLFGKVKEATSAFFG
jgi:hypothetical protein